MTRWGVLLLFLGTLLGGNASGAATAQTLIQSGEALADPALEARAQRISEKLRCPVCSNQAIGESNADLARDLRVLIRKRLLAGDGDQEVVDLIVARYGVSVLLTPPFQPSTYLLWLMPLLLLLGVVGGIIFRFRRPQTRSF